MATAADAPTTAAKASDVPTDVLAFVDPDETDDTYRVSALDAERFWGKVQQATKDACWPWKAGRFDTGYGCFTLNGKSIGAHRIAAFLAIGPCVGWVLHSCDNPPCCNPAHLRYGTSAENAADRLARSPRQHGEDHANAKLTDADVIEMRRAYAAKEMGTPRLARRFGIRQSTCHSIVTGKSWRHIA